MPGEPQPRSLRGRPTLREGHRLYCNQRPHRRSSEESEGEGVGIEKEGHNREGEGTQEHTEIPPCDDQRVG